MKRRFVIGLGTAILLAGCTVGVEVEDFPPAQGPAGIACKARLQQELGGRRLFEGELLAVREDGIVLRLYKDDPVETGGQRLIVVPFWLLKSLWLADVGSFRRSSSEEVNELRLDRLRLLSRFPQGLTPEIERALLDGFGQDALFVPGRDDVGD